MPFFGPPGGGGGSAPTVGVGPSFGPGNANDQGASALTRAALTMPLIQVLAPFAVRAALTMPALAGSYASLVAVTALTMPLIGVTYPASLATRAALTMNAASQVALAARAELVMPSLVTVFENIAAARAKLTATGLGPPIWMDVATVVQQSGSSIAVPYPTGQAIHAGDLLLAFIGTMVISPSSPHAVVNTPTGWTADTPGNLSDTVNLEAAVCWKIADGTESGTQNFTFTDSASAATGEIHLIRGVNQAAPVDSRAHASVLTSAITPDPVSPAVPTGVVNCLVFAWLIHYHASLSQTHTAPASNTERTDVQAGSTVFVGSTSDTRVFAATGSTGTATHDCTESVGTSGVMTRIAIAPGTFTIL